MSQETTNAPTTNANDELPVVFTAQEFTEGPAKGFKYFVPEFNSVDKAVELYGADRVLGLLNGQILARIRTKVKNDLKLGEVKPLEVPAYMQKKLASTGGILFNETDANAWRPDVRELSPGGMVKKITELLQAGKQADAVALAAKLQRVMAEMCQAEVAETTAPAQGQ